MTECIYIVGVSTCVGSGKSGRGDKRKNEKNPDGNKTGKKRKQKFMRKKGGITSLITDVIQLIRAFELNLLKETSIETLTA